ncbi:MAG TPA: response regulator [Chloroflexota bacterium]|jgi:two-component system cell cycle response regulator|nr:response regulator [Chloroflexota bacterium]
MTDSSPVSEADHAGERRLILVVDDEPSVRAIVLASIAVRAERYRVLEAGNAAEALAHARDHRPDLVLLDVALPDHDGFWVCRTLKSDARTAQIPVVMLTAMSLPSDRDKAIQAGADGYIVKPFSPRGLLEELERRVP